MFPLCWFEVILSKPFFCRYKFWTATKDPRWVLRISLPVEILSHDCLDCIFRSKWRPICIGQSSGLLNSNCFQTCLACLTTSQFNLAMQKQWCCWHTSHADHHRILLLQHAFSLCRVKTLSNSARDTLQSDYTIFSAFWFITLATKSIPIIYQILGFVWK